MPDPTVAQGHYDSLLTNVSIGFMQDAKGYVAGEVFPKVPVNFSSSFYWVFPRGYFLRDEVGPRPMGGYPRQVGYNLTKQSYLAEEEALEAMLDDRERKNATPPHDPERGKVRLLTQQHLIHRDRRWASNYFTTGVWTTDVTGVNAGPTGNQVVRWNVTNSTPIEDLDLWRFFIAQNTGFMPNKLILGSKTFRTLRNHAELKNLFLNTNPGAAAQLSEANLAAIFGVDEVLVPMGIYNTAAEGDTDSYSFIVPQDGALLVYAADNPGLEQPSGGYIFTWTGLLGDGAFMDEAALANASAVWRGRDDRAHSDWFQVRQAYDMRVVAPDLGVYFSTVVA